ncbi:MAG: choice-of-anchor tandem repeat GloVer-containing protein [Candidatus Korobacteraceae bacterium]
MSDKRQNAASILDIKPLPATVALILTIMFATGILVPRAAYAQTFQVLHSFTDHGDGGSPEAGLTMGRAGNLYGTTSLGGAGYGTVFKLSRIGSGWILSTIYTFQGGSDGSYPHARVVVGPDGTLYGTTPSGGGDNSGTIFNLRPPATVCRSTQCPWTETVLYRFTGGSDGNGPGYGDLTFDSAGSIYGTTVAGGLSCSEGGTCGVVFKLTRSGGGWMESVLYRFTGGNDGGYPYSGVIFDSAGNLYGTASAGGINTYGTVYELSPSSSGWTETTLHSFGSVGDDGYLPFGGLIIDRQGSLYGTTYGGGAGGGGTVYELQPSGGDWTFSTLYSFAGFDGAEDAPTMDASGNLYGTTFIAGADNLGSVFKLTPTEGGWTYTDLHDFAGGNDGGGAMGSVVLDGNGNVYGTNYIYGSGGAGVAFEITP